MKNLLIQNKQYVIENAIDKDIHNSRVIGGT